MCKFTLLYIEKIMVWVLLSLDFLVKFILEAWVGSWLIWGRKGGNRGTREVRMPWKLGGRWCGSHWGQTSAPGRCACGRSPGKDTTVLFYPWWGLLLSTCQHCLCSQELWVLTDVLGFQSQSCLPNLMVIWGSKIHTPQSLVYQRKNNICKGREQSEGCQWSSVSLRMKEAGQYSLEMEGGGRQVLALLSNGAMVNRPLCWVSSLSDESIGISVLKSNAVHVIVDKCLLKLLRKWTLSQVWGKSPTKSRWEAELPFSSLDGRETASFSLWPYIAFHFGFFLLGLWTLPQSGT